MGRLRHRARLCEEQMRRRRDHCPVREADASSDPAIQPACLVCRTSRKGEEGGSSPSKSSLQAVLHLWCAAPVPIVPLFTHRSSRRTCSVPRRCKAEESAVDTHRRAIPLRLLANNGLSALVAQVELTLGCFDSACDVRNVFFSFSISILQICGIAIRVRASGDNGSSRPRVRLRAC